MFLKSIREHFELRLERHRQLKKIARIRYQTQGLSEHLRNDINLDGYLAKLHQESSFKAPKKNVIYLERVHKKRASP
ncbi:hypothetical protein [Gynuella sunshinyii]|uniref:Uncharacterized protein n=1 Tax=Gynuella sunshinyii YC6258 TaxID=1445510 RepID=A0A0C5VIC7_9GAMM|nr:hypothetical protein [Gynuella sunshinyii]AJQ93108.1 hypothetical Protein YC6258_01060 [Gynuella sunshinyii YC6258]